MSRKKSRLKQLSCSQLKPVSTQERRHWIGQPRSQDRTGLFPSAPPDNKGLNYFNSLLSRLADHRFNLEQKISTEGPRAGSILFRSDAYVPEWKPAFRKYSIIWPAVMRENAEIFYYCVILISEFY